MDLLDEIRLERLWAKYVRTKGCPPPIQAMDLQAAIAFLQKEVSGPQIHGEDLHVYVTGPAETTHASGAEF